MKKKNLILNPIKHHRLESSRRRRAGETREGDYGFASSNVQRGRERSEIESESWS